MKLITTIAILAALSLSLNAKVLNVNGTIATVNTANPLFKVGDQVTFTVNYNSANVITTLFVLVNKTHLNLLRQAESPPSHVYVDDNPMDGTVQWAVLDSNVFNIDVATNTPNGAIPCIDNFDLGRVFQIFFNCFIINGTVTAEPTTQTGN